MIGRLNEYLLEQDKKGPLSDPVPDLTSTGRSSWTVSPRMLEQSREAVNMLTALAENERVARG